MHRIQRSPRRGAPCPQTGCSARKKEKYPVPSDRDFRHTAERESPQRVSAALLEVRFGGVVGWAPFQLPTAWRLPVYPVRISAGRRVLRGVGGRHCCHFVHFGKVNSKIKKKGKSTREKETRTRGGGARCFDDKSGVWEGFVAVPHTRLSTVEVSAGGAVAAVRRGVAVQIDRRRTPLSRGRGAVS